jgi:hypothetical protein
MGIEVDEDGREVVRVIRKALEAIIEDELQASTIIASPVHAAVIYPFILGFIRVSTKEAE